MKPKVLLASVQVNHDYLLTKYYYKLPSLGIGYMAAVLEKNDYDVRLLDKTISHEEIPATADEIVAMGVDVVGFYCVSENFKNVLEILRLVKKKAPTIKTIIGGAHVFGLPVQSLSYDWIDFAMWGETEESFVKFLDTNFDPKRFPEIEGLVYREGNEIKKNPMALVKNLDDLPFPARHLYSPLAQYRPSILAYKRLPATGMLTSRGCSYKCTFCHSGKGDFKLRFHSAEYVLEEIKMLKRDFGINEFILFDDTFTIKKDRVRQICEGIINQKLDISWSCNARVNNITKELLTIMKKAGCWLIQFGVESGNQRILDIIKKSTKLETIVKACKLTYEMGLQVKAYFILGHPGETVESLNDTINFMAKLPAHYASINYMTPLPGTELWDTAEQFGVIDKEKLEKINYLSDTPAFIPFGLTEEILTDKFREAYLKFYLNPKTIFRHLKSFRSTEDFKKIAMAGSILSGIVRAKLARK